MQPSEALALADQLPALAVRADQQPVGHRQVEFNRAVRIFRADILVAFSHAEGMIQQALAHPPSLPSPPKRTNLTDEPENLVWSDKDVNQRKADRLPHEAGLKLLTVPRAPKELPVTALLRNTHGLAEWKLFLNE